MTQITRIDKQNNIYSAYIGTHRCGVCTFVLSTDQPNTIIVLFLDVINGFKNQGIGTRLLIEVMRDAYDSGILRIELEDVSDRCHKKNNIYVKAGLYYKYGNQDNSMRGNLRHIFYG
jgi:GNAT superfamily N-acetyltransferase